MFFVADEKDIKSGNLTDVYFKRCIEVLKKKGVKKHVSCEVRASRFPEAWNWAVLAGIEEAKELFKGKDIDIESMKEGTVFKSEEPVMTISGKYVDFGEYETALLGMLCQASGIATKAARCKIAAGERGIYSFGARRMHPAIAPMIERSAFIGGCDGVAVTTSAELIGEKPVGTMPHSLILMMDSPEKAYEAFDEIMPKEIKRVALVDTFEDEKFGALTAAETLRGRLFAVRLDTPASRRGDFLKIIEEVRWELDLRGFNDVKIFVSGGLDEYKVLEYNPYVDAYGIGTSISSAPVIDFSLDIVEVEGENLSKRGKMSGVKKVYRCQKCSTDCIAPTKKEVEQCECGGGWKQLLAPLIKKGNIARKTEAPQTIREYVIRQLMELELCLD